MAKKKKDYPVGYKKPPQHTRFKPGQSGNRAGRPKRRVVTLPEAIERELNMWITASEGGKRQRLRKLDAVAKQLTNKAINGDPKAVAMVLKVLELRESGLSDNLTPVLQMFRAVHAEHEAAKQNGMGSNENSSQTGDEANDHEGHG